MKEREFFLTGGGENEQIRTHILVPGGQDRYIKQ